MIGLGLFGLWLVLAAVALVSTLVAVGVIWLANRILGDRARGEINSSLDPFITIVALVYGALLGFTVVVAWEQFSSAETNVGNEASTLTTMYRQTVGMPQSEQANLRKLLRDYAVAVKDREWSESGGVASEAARGAIDEMYRVLGSHQGESSAASQEFQSQLTVLASARNERILDAQPRVPWLLWFGLIFGGVVLVGLTGFLQLPSVRGHVGLTGVVAVLLGLLLFIVYTLDHPFGSQIGVTSVPFERAQAAFDAIDRGR
ncbi:DUF4239 domain-containing protein [Mycobacterium sp. OTB74]|uniref:bestrophin-like domain n=1 Tax=Mycobacterium sp. OTB74 TaxID=1853452 RepID=UPI002474C90F|nr:DUF4239 domain-containing protein [Mycobacterium sp. OTB74]